MNEPSHSRQNTAEACARCVRLRKCEECFEELVRRFQSPLLQFLIHRAGSRHDAEDLLQETFLIAYRKISGYRSCWRFSTWLFTIASRAAVSRGRRRRLPLVGKGPEAFTVSNPQSLAERSEMRSWLWNRVGQLLEPDSFTAVWLSYVESMSAEEIGHVLGCSANAVRILLHRARGRLADHLGSFDETFAEQHHGQK